MSALGMTGDIARFDSFHGRQEGMGGAGRYPSPFFDIGHTYLPTSIKQMFRWCRYYFLTNPLINAVTYKMAEYPITGLIVDEEDSEQREKWEEAIEHQLKIRTFQIETGLDYFCFHGDVKAVTRDGVFKLRDLAGKKVDVLSKDGIYRPAEFKTFGRQELLEVEFNDGRTVLATPEHQWEVVTSNGKTIRVPTTELAGRRILRTVAPRPQQDASFYEGARHGFVFGDGTLYNDGKQARAYFYGPKDKEMLKFFEGYKAVEDRDGTVMIHGLPASYKQLPDNTQSASYWYGFLCGFLAADGSVDVNGCAVLTQKAKATLEAVAEQLPRIGMVAGQVRGYTRSTAFTSEAGRIYEYDGEMFFLSLFKQYLRPEDFLLSQHRKNFEQNYKPTKYGSYVHVRDVRQTGIVDEVFCCIEMETHTFVIDNAVLTGNCYGNAFISIHYPFEKFLICPHCKSEFKAKDKRTQFKFRNLKYWLSCPKCDIITEAKVKDVNIKNFKGIRLVRWNPEYITFEHNDVTGESAYFFDLPMATRTDIMMGKRHVIESIPDVFIEAMRSNKSLRFTSSNMFHLKRPTIAQKDMGWGMPLILPVLKDTYYLQILRKAQEAIAQQHIVPLRILFPQGGSSTSDPYSTTDLGSWRRRIDLEIQKWRVDHNYIPVLPLPIGNETIGGEGKALMLHQEMRAWSEQIVAGMHVPVEFVFGGLQYSGSNVSMRMLENQFLGYRTEQLIMVRDFILGKIADYMGWNRPKIHFKRFKMADDLQRLALLFQVNQAQKVSDTTLLDEMDYDIVQEEKHKQAELAKQTENQRRMQLAQAQLQGEVMMVQARFQRDAQKIMMNAPAPAQGAAGVGGAAGGGNEMMPGGGAPLTATDQQPDVGEEAAPGMPEGVKVYPEKGGDVPQEGVPQEMMSPLRQPMGMGAQYTPLYLARRAATHLEKQDEMTKNIELLKMKGSNPQLYSLTLQLLQSGKGSQRDPLDPLQSPLPELRPPRRQSIGI